MSKLRLIEAKKSIFKVKLNALTNSVKSLEQSSQSYYRMMLFEYMRKGEKMVKEFDKLHIQLLDHLEGDLTEAQKNDYKDFIIQNEQTRYIMNELLGIIINLEEQEKK